MRSDFKISIWLSTTDESISGSCDNCDGDGGVCFVSVISTAFAVKLSGVVAKYRPASARHRARQAATERQRRTATPMAF